MKKTVVLLVLLLSALPAVAGSLSTYRPTSTVLPDLPKYALAGANVAHEQRLFASQGGALPLAIDLSFTSVDQLAGELGAGWSHSYEITLHQNPDGTMVMTGGAGTHFYFVTGAGYKPRLGDHSTLLHSGDDTWIVTLSSGLSYHFGSDKQLTAIVDRYGNTVSIDSTVPNQKAITDPVGRKAILHYSAGKIDWIKDPAQGQYDFTYNATSGMLESVTGPVPDASQPNLRPVWEYRYTADSFSLEYAKDPEGHITKYVYTGGRLTRKVDPAGVIDMNGAESADAALHSTTWVYGFARSVADSHAVTRIEKDGGNWVYHYAGGVLVAKEGPSDSQKQHSFYLDVPTTDVRYGLPKEDVVTVDATTQRVTAYVAYDVNGKPTEIKSFVRTLTFDGSGNLIATSDGALDRHLLHTYDSYGRVTATTDLIAGTTTTTAYVVNAGQETVTITAPKINAADASGPQTVLVYRTDGQLESVTDPLGRRIDYAYTSAGLPATVSDATSGVVTSFGALDAFGRPQTITVSKSGQDNRVTQLAYDGLGRLKSSTTPNVAVAVGGDPGALLTRFGYDLVGNRTSVTDAADHTTSYTYNSRGEITSIVDALQQRTVLEYGGGTGCGAGCSGGVDKLSAVIDANQSGQASPLKTSFHYDQLGNLAREEDPLDKAITYTWYPGGHLKEKIDGASGQILAAYTYIPDGRIDTKSVRDASGAMQLTDFSYDANDQLQSVSSPAITYTYAYFDNGWLKSVSDGTRTIEYLYDTLGRREQTTVKQGQILQTLDYVYDPATKALKEIVSSAGTFVIGIDAWGRRGTLTYPNGVVATYSYNGQTDWLIGLTYKNAGGAALLDLTYAEHDKVGNRKERSEDGIVTDYAYDAIYQLTQAKTGASEENFAYDPVGNRESGPTVKDTAELAYEHDAANRMLEGRKDAYAYDDFGNRTYRYLDASHSKYWHYSWDGENRMVAAQLVDAGVTLRTVTFKYDPFGRRIEKKVEGLAPQVPVPLTTTYVYDNEDIVLETINNGTTTTQAQYVHGPGIDEPLARVSGGQSVYYHADGLGSIVALSDSSQAVVQRYAYDTFGMVTSSNLEFENAYTYTGREWDKEIGLYYYRARYYDPMEGRFVSKDPIGFAGGDMNLYRYVQNNPINAVDPTGKSIISLGEIIIVVAVVSVVSFCYDLYQCGEAIRKADALAWRLRSEIEFPSDRWQVFKNSIEYANVMDKCPNVIVSTYTGY